MFVEGVRIGAANAETIERGDDHRASKIAVGAAAGAAVRQFDAERFGDAAGLFIERHGSRVRLPYRAGDAARYLEGDVVGGARQRQHPLDAAVEIGLPLSL